MKGKKSVIGIFFLALAVLSILPFASAGVGISWSQESALIPENSNVCLTYGVYNPWPTDTSVQISLSSSLQDIISSQETTIQDIPKYTYSNQSIPVEFCFRTPKVYTENCLLFNSLLCSQDCSEPMKTYEGQVTVSEVGTSGSAGSGSGSSASMSVSAPLRVRVKCIEHPTNYSIVYLVLGIIVLLILIWRIYKKKSKKKYSGKKSKRK